MITLNNKIYLILSLLCFLADLSCYVLFDHQLLYGLVPIFIAVLMRQSGAFLAVPTLFICLESFIFYGRPFICAWYLLPVALVHQATYRQVYQGPWYPTALGVAALVIQIFFVELCLVASQEPLAFALTKLLGNAIIYLGFFLKLNE